MSQVCIAPWPANAGRWISDTQARPRCCWRVTGIPAVVYEDFIVACMVGVDVFYGEVVDDGGDCLIGEGDYWDLVA